MKQSKIFIVNGMPRVFPPKDPSPPLTSLSAMTVGGSGDPHMYITVSSLDNKKRTVTKTIAAWDDNKPGPSGNNELKLIDLQTTTDSIQIFYTNRIWTQPLLNGAKVISSIRVQLNGVSTTYTNTAKVTAGPITLNILRISSGGGYLNFEAKWDNINNVVKLGGAITVILKRVANNNGKLWNGGAGGSVDGFSRAGAPYGLSRSSFETGIGAQSAEEEVELLSDEANFIASLADNFTQDSNIFEQFNNEEDNTPVSDWDETTAELLPIFNDDSGLEGAVDYVSYYNPSGQSIEV